MFVKIGEALLHKEIFNLPLRRTKKIQTNMKKLFYLFLAATMFVGVVACSETPAPAEEVVEEVEVVEEPAVEEAVEEEATEEEAPAAE